MPIHEQSLIRPENLTTHDQLVVDGVEGAIIGSALYRGAFTLTDALDVAGRR